jgi:3-oxoacyl-[acyl-carrier protein] reductase
MNKIAVVTGGSRGIGRAVSLSLAQSGCTVIVNYLSSEIEAQRTCDAIDELRNGAKGIPIQGDCSNSMEMVALFRRIRDEVSLRTFQCIRYN